MTHRKLVNVAYALVLAVVLLFSIVPPLYSLPSIHHETNISNLVEHKQGVHVQTGMQSSDFVEPIIRRSTTIDKDLDGIQDSLENLVPQVLQTSESAGLPVVVTLSNPVLNQDLDWFGMLGGRVSHVYRYVTYGFAGVIPAANITQFASIEGTNLSIIEYDAPIQYHLDVSTPLVRVRPHIWNTYGYMGSSNHSVAIIDTGIDDSHPDVGPYGNLNFSKKMVGWYDATVDNVPAPQDYGEHGTHVAGIAAGTGTANNLQGSGIIETTFTYFLPTLGYGYLDYIDVMTPGIITLNLDWSGGNTVLLRIYNPAGSVAAEKSDRKSPLTLTYDTTGTSYPTGRYRVLVGNSRGPSGSPFSCIESYPYQGLNDGYNLFTGVAPASKLVGVKVFDNRGSGTISTLIAGMDWIIQNRFLYRIVVASMSLGLTNGAVDSTLDQKADTMVKNGIVTTVSAGNDYPTYTIGSPGTAAYVITVGATNDQNSITSYSSNGDSAKNEFGLIKPDVAAPGGTFQPEYGNQIISADSNDVDASYSGYADRNTNDYQQMAGTSMSAPHVAGLAALIVQAFGGWNWTLEEALRVKMLLSMTAFETQLGEGTNLPALNRGGKDSVEGYGLVSADAAIEAAIMNYSVGETASATLGAGVSEKKVWARQVSLSAGATYRFNLSVPADADYDLYLYDGNPDNYGQPVVLEKSTNATQGVGESFQFTPQYSGTHYILAKWVSGHGEFNLTSTIGIHDVAPVNIEVQPTSAYPGRIIHINVTVENQGDFAETFNVTVYADRDNAVIGDEVLVGQQTVDSLPAGATTTLYFDWDTTGASHGNYWISAVTSAVPGETDTTDNTLAGGAFVGGIYPPYIRPEANTFALLAPLALALLVLVVLGTATIGFFKILMSPRIRLPRLD